MSYQAFLNVETSCTGKRWLARSYDERLTLALAQHCSLPDIIARVLNARDIGLENADSFLDPKLRNLLPNPSVFRDMDKATARFALAIQRNEKIAIFGDYDVDGATSSALLTRFMRALGNDPRLYIPDRMTEGYGPNPAAMKTLAAEGVTLTICVDCGTTAHEALATAKDAGMDVLVLDHHTSEPTLPPALAIVNPNRIDEPETFHYLAAVGVTFLFAVGSNRALRAAGYFSETQEEPDLRQELDLVALGTVCDVVKLIGLNRAFVAQGIKIMRQRQNKGLAALMQTANVRDIDSYAMGFILGPRINAAGRIGDSSIGARLLSTENEQHAIELASRLSALNEERREVEAHVLAEAEKYVLSENLPMGYVASDNWHPGVIGIVASRLKDKFRHPALVIALEGDIGKGSGRSIGNIDLGATILAARQAGLLINGGGHKMAAGFTVARDKIDALRDFLAERIGKQMEAEPLIPTLTLDGIVSGPSLKTEFMAMIGRLGPFGTGNSEPRFALPDCKIVRANVVGEKHVSVVLSQGGRSVKGIAFRAMENELGPVLLQKFDRLHVAGHLRTNEWQGEKQIQIHISDVALVK